MCAVPPLRAPQQSVEAHVVMVGSHVSHCRWSRGSELSIIMQFQLRAVVILRLYERATNTNVSILDVDKFIVGKVKLQPM